MQCGAIMCVVVQITLTNPDTTPDRNTLTLTERAVADMLGVKLPTMRLWRRTGRGPRAYRLSYRCVRYSPRDVDTWLRARAVSGDAP